MNPTRRTILYPLTFTPLFKERVWGGRKLEQLYHKPLPPAVPIGESWEISDRLEDNSLIANGPFAGQSLHWLMENYGTELMGDVPRQNGRFPLLVKILDAREKLSLQVHPPREKATALGGEPKTELWYIADAAPGAELYVGLRAGTTRAEFERRIHTGDVAECFHRIAVRPGDAMFLPSGRVHALGSGLVIFEIQQNSDTTYRVFDWNRIGLDGKPRALHLRESLESIAFDDFEPNPTRASFHLRGSVQVQQLIADPLFEVEVCRADAGTTFALSPYSVQVIGVISGHLEINDGRTRLELADGQFCLVPASLEKVSITMLNAGSFLRAVPGRG